MDPTIQKDHATDITQARTHHHPNPLHPPLNTKPNPIQPLYDKPGTSLMGHSKKVGKAQARTTSDQVPVSTGAPSSLVSTHLKAPKTRQTYNAQLNRGRKWLIQQVEAHASARAAPSPHEPPVVLDDEWIQNPFLHPKAHTALDTPEACTPALLAQYITHQCVTEHLSESTASAIHAAFKLAFMEIPGGKYTGPWRSPQSSAPEGSECSGNPCDDLLVRNVMKSIRNRDWVEGAQHQHSCAMKLQDLRTIWEISMKHCPGNVVDRALGGGLADLEERALVFKHLLWRAFSSLAWTLWTQNFETTNFHFSDLNYDHQEDHGVPHVQITLSNCKGWQKRAQKGDPNLEELR
ncbi:hypothetical protein BS47DRAFT_1368735 [Hydnum rufescens UP504]|uniref:Uncharacterized protein n=1 Tax=Hydnum rufescens UP504 TaxID=1448309 RepID=A0A9P6AFA7_9AGAM|nr:hypothetical protein BS47DRAFT_1368735 [Hydnum rufescens UP504]